MPGKEIPAEAKRWGGRILAVIETGNKAWSQKTQLQTAVKSTRLLHFLSQLQIQKVTANC